MKGGPTSFASMLGGMVSSPTDRIMLIQSNSMNVERDIRFDLIARLCPNTTGAELRSVATEAGMFAIRSRRKVASERDFLDAVEKVVRQGTKFSSTYVELSNAGIVLLTLISADLSTKFITSTFSYCILEHSLYLSSYSIVVTSAISTLVCVNVASGRRCSRTTMILRHPLRLQRLSNRRWLAHKAASNQPSSAEVTALLSQYAATAPLPLNLSQLLSFGRPVTPNSVLS